MATSVFFYSGCWYEYQNTTVFQTQRRMVRLCCLCWSGAGSWRLLDGFRLRSWAEHFAACTLEVKVPATLTLTIRCQMQGISPFDSYFNWAVCHHTHTSTQMFICILSVQSFQCQHCIADLQHIKEGWRQAGLFKSWQPRFSGFPTASFFCITHCFHRCDVLELSPSWKLIHQVIILKVIFLFSNLSWRSPTWSI